MTLRADVLDRADAIVYIGLAPPWSWAHRDYGSGDAFAKIRSVDSLCSD